MLGECTFFLFLLQLDPARDQVASKSCCYGLKTVGTVTGGELCEMAFGLTPFSPMKLAATARAQPSCPVPSNEHELIAAEILDAAAH